MDVNTATTATATETLPESTAQTATPSVASPVQVDPNDPFAFDESKLLPDQKAALQPILSEIKNRATKEWEKRQKSVEDKYKPHQEKAEALDNLAKHPAFQKWWIEQQQAMANGQAPGAQKAIANTKPQDFASNEEWSQAVLDASNGDPTKFQGIQQRMFTMMATPIVQKFQQDQQALKNTLAMRDLFERHPDAKELDLIGRNGAEDKTPSLLEIAFDYVEKQGKPMEDGYKLAKQWVDAMGSKAKQEAMGMVAEKKGAVTATPSGNTGGQTIVEVDDTEQLVRKSLEAQLSGEKNMPRFVIRKKQK